MRVLFWSELFWPYIGGAEIFATKLILALQQRCYECLVVTRQDSPDLPSRDSYKGIEIRRFPFWVEITDPTAMGQLINLRKQVVELKRKFAPDLVHIHGFGPTSVLFHLDTNTAYPAPLLLTLIDELSEVAAGDSFSRVLRCADWVTGKARSVLSQARQKVPKITPYSSVIHNGIGPPAILPEPLPFDKPRLLCLGRLAHQKGTDVALKALATITHRFPEVRLVLAGDGPERSELARQVAGLGLEDVVEFTGWVAPDDIPALINTATMVLMPSRWEGLPSVALQASMMARPLVATPVGGLSEVVLHGRTGLLVPRDDPLAIAEAITFLLERPSVAMEMGHAARLRVQDVFSWNACVDSYDNLYRQLATEASH